MNNIKNQLLCFTVLLLIVLFSGYESRVYAQNNSVIQSDSIRHEFDRFQEALLSRDTMIMKNIYAENAVSLLQNQPVRIGRGTIIERWKKTLAAPVAVHAISQDINVSSSMQDAFQYGSFEISSTDSAHTLLASGKIMFLWRKEPDKWRIVLEMDNFNSNKPPQSTVKPKQ